MACPWSAELHAAVAAVLDVGATAINDEMKIACAEALSAKLHLNLYNTRWPPSAISPIALPTPKYSSCKTSGLTAR